MELLIVLNGIEILNLAYDKIKHKTFNRTKWN